MLLIYNPIAGTHRGSSTPEEIVAAFKKAGREVRLAFTAYKGHAHDLAKQALADGEKIVLVCGGDGTVNEAASALIETDVVLGILPNGSGNAVARHLQIPVNPLKAIDIIREGSWKAIDWCDANGRPFFAAFGIGFDAAVAKRFSEKKRRGFRTYIKSAFEVFPSYKAHRYIIRTAEGDILDTKAMFVTCCNTSQLGNNAYLAPHASVTDGLMDITVVEKSNIFNYARLGIDLMAGAIHSSLGLKMLRTKAAHILCLEDSTISTGKESSNTAASTLYPDGESIGHSDGESVTMEATHFDGEPAETGREIEVKVHHAGLKVFVNLNWQPIRPWLTPLHIH